MKIVYVVVGVGGFVVIVVVAVIILILVKRKRKNPHSTIDLSVINEYRFVFQCIFALLSMAIAPSSLEQNNEKQI